MTSTATTTEPTEGACAYVIGEDGLATWSDMHAEAWIGMVETYKQLTRALESELDSEHGLSLSGLELLGRLASADGHHLRLSALATASGLSLSRASRIVDVLESRRLVARQSYEGDRRAVEAHLTDSGLTLTRRARATHFASVRRRFFDKLAPAEVEALAGVFGRFAPRAAEACTSD